MCGDWTTTSGGASWSTLTANPTGFDPFTGVDIVNVNLGISLTQSGTVRIVTSGVESIFSIGVPGTYRDITFPVNGAIGYVCGDGGAVFKSIASGQNWFDVSPARLQMLPYARAEDLDHLRQALLKVLPEEGAGAAGGD